MWANLRDWTEPIPAERVVISGSRSLYPRHHPLVLRAIQGLILAPKVKVIMQGGALGVDVYSLRVAWALRKRANSGFPLLVTVVPDTVEEQPQEVQQAIHEYSDTVVALHREITFGDHWAAYQYRNEWMADRCKTLHAFWNERGGGTRNMIEYARKQKLEVNVHILKG